MNDDTITALDHSGHEKAVETDSGEQIQVDLIKP
jgi:hypothetical protein